MGGARLFYQIQASWIRSHSFQLIHYVSHDITCNVAYLLWLLFSQWLINDLQHDIVTAVYSNMTWSLDACMMRIPSLVPLGNCTLDGFIYSSTLDDMAMWDHLWRCFPMTKVRAFGTNERNNISFKIYLVWLMHLQWCWVLNGDGHLAIEHSVIETRSRRNPWL